VDYTGDYATFNPHRFGQQFVDQVANPKEVVYFHRRKTMVQKNNEATPVTLTVSAEPEVINVEDLVTEFLTAQHLDMLPENKVNEAIRLFVEKDDKDAIPE
jgi:double-strand break repair protein MRE11